MREISSLEFAKGLTRPPNNRSLGKEVVKSGMKWGKVEKYVDNLRAAPLVKPNQIKKDVSRRIQTQSGCQGANFDSGQISIGVGFVSNSYQRPRGVFVALS